MKLILDQYEKDTIQSVAQSYDISTEHLKEEFQEHLSANFDDLFNDFIINHIEEVLQEA